MRRPLIAIVGNGALAPGDPREDLAFAVGRALVAARFRLLSGGLGGVMAAACRGARSAGEWCDGDIVGILPGLDATAANPWVDVAIATGLGHLRNALVARADAVVAIGGGAGTLSEIAMAWVADRPVLAFRVEGWSGRLADQRLDARVRFPDRPDDRIYGVDTASEAIASLCELTGWSPHDPRASSRR